MRSYSRRNKMIGKQLIVVMLCVMIISITFFNQLVAQNSNSKNGAPTLNEFSSLIGHWRGEGLEGVCEETWLPESAQIMLGTFKLMQNDQVNFLEIMTLSIDSIGPAVRVKHFNADMTAWEDKADMVIFRHDSTSAGKFFFGGLTFMKPTEDSLNIGIRFKASDGSRSEETINCRRVELK